MSELLYRIAVPEDAAEILEIYKPYVVGTSITFEYDVPSLEEFEGRIRRTLQRYPYIVAVRGGEIIGYAYAGEFKGRRAYDWGVEASIYVKMGETGGGVGRKLYELLEELLAKQGILNVNACIAYPEVEDEYLTRGSVLFHEKMGYRMVGTFHQCGYKFGRWYDMVWMEKMIGEHVENQPPVIPFADLTPGL